MQNEKEQKSQLDELLDDQEQEVEKRIKGTRFANGYEIFVVIAAVILVFLILFRSTLG